MKLYLASTSKFKSSLLDNVMIKHHLIKSNYEEYSNEKDPIKYVISLAKGKVDSVKDKVNDGIIIGIDTVVLCDNLILEKPVDIEEARQNIKLCMNKTTAVITGISIYNAIKDEEINDSVVTDITLREINDNDIDYYLEHEVNVLNASGFVIESVISNFIKEIKGSYYNILGVPVETIYKIINDMGYYLKDFE